MGTAFGSLVGLVANRLGWALMITGGEMNIFRVVVLVDGVETWGLEGNLLDLIAASLLDSISHRDRFRPPSTEKG